MKNQKVEEYYEIEKILDKKIENDQVKYKVKWKGYPISEATWEPLRNFLGNMAEIDNFERNRKSEREKEIENFKKERNNEERLRNINTYVPSKIMVDSPMSLKSKPIKTEKDKKVPIKNEKIDRYLSPRRNYPSPKKIREVNIKREKSPSPYYLNQREEEYDEENNYENSYEEDSHHHHHSRNYQKQNYKEVVEQKMKQGFLGRDKPDQIISAKRHIDLPRELLCEISWKKRKNNTTPLNSFYLNSEIKKYHPMLLVNYYEEHLIFPKRKDKKEHYYK